MPSTTATERKKALRLELKGRERPDYAPLLARFSGLEQVKRAKGLLLFYGVGNEPDTRPLLQRLLAEGKRVALPRCLPGGGMEARWVSDLSGLVPNRYGIPEPGEDAPLARREELDVILVPNLCCDRAGYRLGHGGGYYDRYLAGYRGFTVALCPEELMVDALPREEHDRPVELVISR